MFETGDPRTKEQILATLDPHPLLGRLTLREMLFFTIYHNAHHARRVDERSAGDS